MVFELPRVLLISMAGQLSLLRQVLAESLDSVSLLMTPQVTERACLIFIFLVEGTDM